MKVTEDSLRLSATDLANHLACHHLSHLDLAAAQGRLRPPDWFPPDAAVLRERGIEHEDAFLTHLEAQGLSVARPGAGRASVPRRFPAAGGAQRAGTPTRPTARTRPSAHS